MNSSYIYTSMLRISDIDQKPFRVEKLDKIKWKTGDYVVGKIIDTGSNDSRIELINGRMRSFMKEDMVIGALGERYATLEATGTWKEVGSDGKMHLLTGAGLFGKCTSKSAYLANLIEIEYAGHVVRDQEIIKMDDFVPEVKYSKFNLPVILLVGTSMSAGKTTSARIIVNQLKRAGLKIVAGKLTGASRYRDTLSLKDVGANYIFDFVDIGLPSSIYPREKFRKKLIQLLSRINSVEADVAVIELGASPLEPYNGDIAFEELKDHVKCTVLCASDPYAVYGVMKSFNLKPDIVSGIATNTYAGAELIEKLCHVKALNLIDPDTSQELRAILSEKLNRSFD
ncbi:MAG: NAD-dependent epimerase/dehydratase family protein [Flavobacteriaceae bacterium]|nr:NAD-dependent epimerase/dehydratase family protein [Flavobacteriaceae bacterium]